VVMMGKSFLRRALSGKISPEELKRLSKSFDIVGDIAIVKIPPSLESKGKIIAEAIVTANKSVKTILNQASPVMGDLRLRQLKWVWGERRAETIYKEYGCLFKVDLSKVYFSPRLSYERMRLARLVKRGEVVVNMFAGVGCFSILIAKHSEASRVYSIDINPKAVQLMRENISLNKVDGRVEAILGDAREVVETRLKGEADRVLMPLPAKAYEYLDAALIALRPFGGFVHYYDFIHARKEEKPVEGVVERVRERMGGLKIGFEVASSRVVRTVGPNWYLVVLDMRCLNTIETHLRGR
jgi:tRNA (guanine37-N1)-methyltransferase